MNKQLLTLAIMFGMLASTITAFAQTDTQTDTSAGATVDVQVMTTSDHNEDEKQEEAEKETEEVETESSMDAEATVDIKTMPVRLPAATDRVQELRAEQMDRRADMVEQREDMKETRMEIKTEVQATMEDRAEHREDMAEKRKTRLESVREHLKTQLGVIVKRIAARLKVLHERLTTLHGRIESAIEVSEGAGQDVSAATTATADAKASLDSAATDLADITVMIDTWFSVESTEDFTSSVKEGREQLKALTESAKGHLRSAWLSLKEAVRILKENQPPVEASVETEAQTDTETQ